MCAGWSSFSPVATILTATFGKGTLQPQRFVRCVVIHCSISA
jgi:hypothetical protein